MTLWEKSSTKHCTKRLIFSTNSDLSTKRSIKFIIKLGKSFCSSTQNLKKIPLKKKYPKPMSNNYSPKSSPKPKNNEPCTNASSSRKKTIFKAPASHLKFRNHLSWNTTKTLSRGQSCGSKRPSRVVTRPNPENTIRKMKKKSVVYSKVKRNDNLTYFNVSFIIRNEKKNDENCFSIE